MSQSSGSGDGEGAAGEGEAPEAVTGEASQSLPPPKNPPPEGDPTSLGARVRGVVPGTSIQIKAPWFARMQLQKKPRESADVIPFARRQRPSHSAEKDPPMSSAASLAPAAESPAAVSGPPASAGPQLPRVDAPRLLFAGFEFSSADRVPSEAGVFILACRIDEYYYPAFIGGAEDMAAAVAAFTAQNPAEADKIDRIFFMPRAAERLRAQTVRDLVRKFDPPLNTDHRAGPAAPEIAALLGDRAAGADDGAREQLAVEIHVTEADLEKLVKEFYASASADPLLAPIFSHAIHDWEGHYQIVQNFWSRTLLGTSRYTGNPFSAHVMLKLTPDHFDRWVAIFKTTAERVLEPIAAQRAIAKVEHMSTCFQAGLFLPPVDGSGPQD